MTVAELRRRAVQAAFPVSSSLDEAIARAGFVQADPIRAPARAQDLMLRQRVEGYRAGDLEAHYPALDIDEDFLYAYGFASRALWQLLHPKRRDRLTALQKRVLALVEQLGEAHPADLEAHLGAQRAVNAWGGYSKASTRALDYLHYYGLLRVARRDKGIRVYAPARPHLWAEDLRAPDKHQRLAAAIVALFAPVPEKSLSQVLRLVQNYARVPLKDLRKAFEAMLRCGELARREVDGVRYLLPAALLDSPAPPPAPRVRILAPFDPLVWDRGRFEHLWGWTYRFEAYTPPAKRTMGYYAMPLLWNDA
ncbi:MAG: YcaQ family DNA glycosylase, partial [Bryobacterales bacterium]|nr:YcaQ family DNA glycosylase [Bryobacterales bacterium]